MNHQPMRITPDYDGIIADPLFKAGYREGYQQMEHAVDARWSEAELLAYERGRQFGCFVGHEDEGFVPLTRGTLAHPRAKLLLIRAMHLGIVA